MRTAFPPVIHLEDDSMFRSVAAVAAWLLLALTFAGSPAHAGGGGANAVFSLDRASPTLGTYGYSAADLFVDDPGSGPGTPLTLALPAVGLDLPSGANVVGLSSGLDNGFLAILGAIGLEPNPLDIPEVRYQFSANRTAVDGVTGAVTIPFVGPINIEQTTPTFPEQFTDLDQAGDVFDNVVNLDRLNFVQVFEENLKLIGGPGAPIDNLDALESLGSFGVVELDGNGDLRPDVPVYFVLDGASGLGTSTIFVKPAGLAPRVIFASAAMLGLVPGDMIDAVSVRDQTPGGGGQDLVFNVGDGLIFSLAEGSASLPMTVGGVSIDEGGIFLAIPGSGIIAALPGGYFSLEVGDELDAIHVVDPRVSPLLPCLSNPTGDQAVRPFEGLSLVQSEVEVTVSDPPVHVAVYLNEMERTGDLFGVTDYSVTATSMDPTVAVIESAVPSWCGWEPGSPVGVARCEQCAPGPPPEPPYWTGPCPGDTGTLSASWIRGLEGTTPPLMGPNICLGDVHIRPVSEGWVRIVFSGSAAGDGGIKTVASAEMVLRVTGTAGGVAPGDPGVPDLAFEIRSAASSRETEITFVIPESGGDVRLVAFDVSGRRMRELVSGFLDPGSHQIRWDMTNDAGTPLVSGLYLLRLETPWGLATRRMIHVE